MKKNTLLALTILSLILAVGCTPKAPDITATETPAVATEATTDATESTTTPESDSLQSTFDALIATNPGPIAIKKFIMDFSNDMDQNLTTAALTAWLDALYNGLTEEIDLYYAEGSQTLHESISNTIAANAEDFASSTTVFSSEKSALLKGIQDPKHAKTIASSFEKGYALVSAEGTFYPVIDYVTLSETYSKQVTENMSEYFKLMALEQKTPVTSEAYLAISPNELGQRALSYENYLKVYPKGIYREDIRILLMTSIWKLVNPTPFDGLLTEEYKIAPDLAATYDELLKHAEAPVVFESVKGILAYSEGQNGILGTIDNMDDLMTESYKLHQEASDKIYELYTVVGE